MLNGRLYIRTTKTTNKNKATEVAKVYEQELIDQVILGKEKPSSVKQVLDLYLNSRRQHPNYETVHAHCKRLLEHLDGSLPADKVKPHDLQSLINAQLDKGLSKGTINGRIRVWNAANAYAELNHMRRGPRIKIPFVDPRRETTISREEVDIIAAELWRVRHRTPYGTENYGLFITLADTGARLSEITRLAWNQVDLEKRTITLIRTKNTSATVLLMTQRVYEYIAAYANNPDKVFPTEHEESRFITRAAKRAGINKHITQYTLRHSFATHLINNGLTLSDVAYLLGHRNLATTAIYAKRDNRAVAVSALSLLDGGV
jgi:integrase